MFDSSTAGITVVPTTDPPDDPITPRCEFSYSTVAGRSLTRAGLRVAIIRLNGVKNRPFNGRRRRPEQFVRRRAGFSPSDGIGKLRDESSIHRYLWNGHGFLPLVPLANATNFNDRSFLCYASCSLFDDSSFTPSSICHV